MVYVKKELEGNETFRLTRIDGAEIAKGHFDGELYVGNVANGLYILSIESAKGAESFMLVVEK